MLILEIAGGILLALIALWLLSVVVDVIGAIAGWW
jgi:hypothetical protein